MYKTIALVACVAALALAAGGCNKNKRQTADGGDGSELGDGLGGGARSGNPLVDGTEVATGNLRELLLTLHRVHFPFDSSTLSDTARAALADAAEQLNAHPDVELWVDGHTDDRGTTEYNMSLGDRRARVVVDYLGRYGVAAKRLGVISYGEERPLANGSSAAALARNRRVEFRLLRGSVQLVLADGDLVDDDGKPL